MNRLRVLLVVAFVAFGVKNAGAQTQRPPVEEPRKIFLWQNGAPGAKGSEEADKPSITYFPPWGKNLVGHSRDCRSRRFLPNSSPRITKAGR